ncbi:MAG: hypothetical protein FJX25_10220 [Alphaproteobacteria bacterium]|nr:hypothetical protein [Alphaproteobacteria bacterium]
MSESNIVDITGQKRTLEDYIDALSPSLKSGDGGGTFDPMEQRVARLEEDMREVKADLRSLVKDVAEIKGKISNLPGWGGLIAITGFIVAAVGLMLRFMPPSLPS